MLENTFLQKHVIFQGFEHIRMLRDGVVAINQTIFQVEGIFRDKEHHL